VKVALDASLEGRLLRRYKRFFADIETRAGERLTVHCPNPGSMRGLIREGAPVRCSRSDNPRRKLRHTLEMVRVGRTWVGLHTGRANAVAEAALRAGAIETLSGYRSLRREVATTRGSRIDFLLEDDPADSRPAWVEVKSVTLAEGSLARFPDSVTERGRRHALALAQLVESGARAALLFVVQRADCDRVEPAEDIDPAYASALREAASRGVEVLALGTRVDSRSIRVEGALPVLL
jgi:sugar fermentation stimulation protein A